MFKKSLSVVLVVIMTVIAVTTLPITSSARETTITDAGVSIELAETGNPYDRYATDSNGYWANCTYWAWQYAYEYDGVSLPGWSHGGTWYASAQRAGYNCDKTPSAHSIMCTGSGTYGHVAYVTEYNSATGQVYIKQGGYRYSSDGRDERWVSAYPSDLQGYIHLDGGHANIGDSFYAFIINTSMWKHLTVDQNLNVTIRSEKSHYCADQVFKFERQSDGSYKIISTANGYCLDVSNASTEAGANVGVYSGNDTDAQRWYLIGSSGNYYIKSKCSECVLDIYSGNSDEGTNVQMYTENGTAAQKFQVYKIEDRPFASDIGTQFTAPILNTKSWITLENDEDNNLSLQKETGMSRQLWQFKRQKDGSYKLYSCYDGKCIDLYWAYHEDGTNIELCNENSNDAQRWYFYSTNGGYIIQSKESGKVFDVYSGHFEYGTNIQAWTWNDTDSQKFTVYKGDECKLSSPTLSIDAGTSTTDTVFRWNNVYGESGYNLKIWKDKIGEGDADILVNDADIETKLTLPAGTYQAVVEAYHFYESKKSNTVTFTVVQGEDPINPEVSILGDADGDGTVSIVDATTIQRRLASLTTAAFVKAAADADEDGSVTIVDATAIQRHLAHLPTNENIGKPIK
jgi:surface antigen